MIEFAIAGLLAVSDLLIKAKIERELQDRFPRSLPYTKGLISVRRFHNDGFPFGVFREHFAVVRGVTLAVTSAVAGVLAYLMTQKGYRLEKAGLTLVLGGAISNLYDRMIRKYVVDYFTIEAGGLKKVVFNLGDIFVFIGSSLFLLAVNRQDLES